ncbi:MAG TPA: TIGR03621 family F420-dependent LLM class oxidoreductase [Candidatus Limnocylindrales bacterium]|nr:TIGR03621 family F420-dependent LLM class oxidoreductase [Candidatus Limnocylindrales bacterium]
MITPRAPLRPFQLMVGSTGAADGTTVAEQARWAESVGFTHVAVHDHLYARHAPMPLLATVAAVTERVGLCPLVLNNDLRHPAVLAQELASLDVLSGGRVVVGVGAGWNQPEYAATGIEFDRPGTRIDRMLESIAILRGLFADGPFSYQGRFYTITDMDGGPKPVQKPHPPFLVGGTREKVLRVAAREADIVGLDLRQRGEAILDAFEARTEARIGWIRDEVGDRIGSIDINVLRAIGDLSVTNEPLKVAGDVARALEARTGVAISARDVLESPFSMIGSVPELVEKLRTLRQRWGINSFLVGWFDDEAIRDIAPVIEQLAGT